MDDDSSEELTLQRIDDPATEELGPGVEFLVPPPAAHGPQPYLPLREYAEREVPQTILGLLGRALREAGWIAPIVYVPLAVVLLWFQRVPWSGEVFAWPGQALATFVLGFCLLERTVAARQGEQLFDVADLGAILWRTLIFLFPILTGLGTFASWEAWFLFPPVFLAAPLLLGAMATYSWGELTPKGLWVAWRQTPSYLRSALLSSTCLTAGMAAVWAFPDGNALARGLVATIGVTAAGALAGASRRDVEEAAEPA